MRYYPEDNSYTPDKCKMNCATGYIFKNCNCTAFYMPGKSVNRALPLSFSSRKLFILVIHFMQGIIKPNCASIDFMFHAYLAGDGPHCDLGRHFRCYFKYVGK